MRQLIFVALVATCTALAVGADDADEKPASKRDQPVRELFTGKVVLLTEALQRRDLEVAEEMQGQVVLETPDNMLIPIVADWRGRAFFQDKRLRDRKVELVGFRTPGTPYLQVLSVYTFDKQGRRQYTDYWCDVCAIAMYQIVPCECCQGPIRLRFQPQDLPDNVIRPDTETKPDATSDTAP